MQATNVPSPTPNGGQPLDEALRAFYEASPSPTPGDPSHVSIKDWWERTGAFHPGAPGSLPWTGPAGIVGGAGGALAALPGLLGKTGAGGSLGNLFRDLGDTDVAIALSKGHPQAEEAFIERILPRLRGLTRRYSRGNNTTAEDLAQEGAIGALEAARGWVRLKPSAELMPYAMAGAINRIEKAVRTQGAFGFQRAERGGGYIRQLEAARASFLAQHGKEPSASDLSEATGMSVKRIQGLLGSLGVQGGSIRPLVNEQGKMSRAVRQAQRGLEEVPGAEPKAEGPDVNAVLNSVADRLTEKERALLQAYLADPTKSTRALAEGLGVKPSGMGRSLDSLLHKLSRMGLKMPPPISGGSGSPNRLPLAFTPKSLFNLKTQWAEGEPTESPRSLLSIGRNLKQGPGMEPWYGQPSYPRGLRPGLEEFAPEPVPMRLRSRGLEDPYGNPPGAMHDPNARIPVAPADQLRPHSPQSYDMFRKLQQLLLRAGVNSGRN